MIIVGRAEVWHVGEDLAADYLQGLGWRILARNWRCALGELDIVALDVAEPVVVFCEVKTRRGLSFGHPLESVTKAKVARLRQLAGLWLREHPGEAQRVRLDAIGVLLTAASAPQITHLRGIE